MKNTTDKNSEVRFFHAERPAHAPGLNHALFLTVVVAMAFALTALAGVRSSAAMQLNATGEKSARVLAYAEPMQERFGGHDEAGPR